MVANAAVFTTVVAANYQAQARVLARSLRRTSPTSELVVLVVDEVPLPDEPGLRWIGPTDIGLSTDVVHRMAAMYDVVELATAMKPTLLLHLLGSANVALYLDPDVEVFDSLDPLVDAARQHSLVLTPHRFSPVRPGGRPEDRELLVAGACNLGFVATSRGAEPFLRWWASKLATDCVVAPEEGLFVDQRWLDLARIYFPHQVLPDKGCNVAWWNIDEREVEVRNDRFFVGDEPLRFFHFSGFNPDEPNLLYHRDAHHPRPIAVPPGAIRALVDAYASQLVAAGWRSARSATYRYGATTRGEPLTPAVRRAYRWATARSMEGNGQMPPSPFDVASAAEFTKWARPTRRVERALRALRGGVRRVRGGGSGALGKYTRVLTSE